MTIHEAVLALGQNLSYEAARHFAHEAPLEAVDEERILERSMIEGISREPRIRRVRRRRR